jgi:hypothetical protein
MACSTPGSRCHLSDDPPLTGAEGATIFVKVGHLGVSSRGLDYGAWCVVTQRKD